MIKVLHVFGIMNRGGAENMLMTIYRNIDKNEFGFDFVVHGNIAGAFEEEIRKLGGNIYFCPKFCLKNIFAYKKWWKSFFKTNKGYDIIHTHVRSSAFIYLKLAKKYGIKTISHSHSVSNGKGINAFIKKLNQISLGRISDRCLACSEEAGIWLFGKKIVNNPKFIVIKNSIDICNYRFDESKRNYIREKNNFSDMVVFIHVGRFSLVKNHFFLLDVFKEINKVKKNTKLLLVGSGELEKKIKSRIKRLNLNEDVLIVGSCDNVGDYLSAADIFLFPSKWEGLGTAVVEAQANGLKCYISNNIPNDAIVIKTAVCRLPIKNNKKEWADMILKNIDNNKRINYTDEFEISGYDISKSLYLLSALYKNVCN